MSELKSEEDVSWSAERRLAVAWSKLHVAMRELEVATEFVRRALKVVEENGL